MALMIERVGWGDLRPHPENPRAVDTAVIRESVMTSGVYRPVICASDGTILAGHHLWAALGELGHTEVDIIRLPMESSSPEALRVMLVDNRSADVGGYDEGVLLGVLSQVDDSVGLLGTGYGEKDLQALKEWLDSDETLGDVLRERDWEKGPTVVLTIPGLSEDDVAAFRGMPGKTDADRLRNLMHLDS